MPDPRADLPVATGAASGDVLVHVRAVLPVLRPAERRVADAVLADPAGASRLAITALAEQAGTSVTTVMRFCRTVGLANYPQLRLALAGSAAREHALVGDASWVNSDIVQTDSTAQIVRKIVHSEARALEETGENLDLAVLDRAIDAVAGARRIDVIGTGASGFVARDLHQKLHRIGLLAFVWTDPHAALTAAAVLRPGDVAIGISHSGTTVDTVEPLQAAAARGATTLALTNFAGTPITRGADLVLRTAVRESPFRSGATVSRIAQLAVLDCLFVGVAQHSYDTTTAALADTWDAVRPRRTGTPRT